MTPLEPLTIVAVYAHPDDGEFHAAGSLAKWAAAGHRVHAICATDGALGSKRRADPKLVASERARELAAALATVGGAEPVMLGFPDGFLREHAAALRERLVFHFRRLRPDRVITLSPATSASTITSPATVSRRVPSAKHGTIVTSDPPVAVTTWNSVLL